MMTLLTFTGCRFAVGAPCAQHSKTSSTHLPHQNDVSAGPISHVTMCDQRGVMF